MEFAALFAEVGIAPEGSRAIQLALAPVFLLTGIAGLLKVLTDRLSRIIDRGRYLTESPQSSITLPEFARASELQTLERRRRLVGVAITTCTLSALLICLVIVLLFGEVLLELPLKWLEGILFMGATVALIIGLTCFLREVHFATKNMRIEYKSIKLEATAPADATVTPGFKA